MIDRKIKIKDKWYEYISCDSQLRMTFAGYDNHAMDLTVRLNSNFGDFEKLFNINNLDSQKSYKFEIRLGNLILIGCFITNIDSYTEYFEVNIICDSFRELSKSELRDEKLDLILRDKID